MTRLVPEEISEILPDINSVLHSVSACKFHSAVIPDLIRYPEDDRRLDSGLRTAGMTDVQAEFMHRLYSISNIVIPERR
jgi:hypothetical protein